MIPAKHIGLESFRVRNCDPDADCRFPINRESRSWNGDGEFGEPGQNGCFAGCDWLGQSSTGRSSTRLHVSGWAIVTPHDTLRRLPPLNGVEPLCRRGFTLESAGYDTDPSGSAGQRPFDRSNSCLSASWESKFNPQTVRPFGLVGESNCIAPFFVMFMSFSGWGLSRETLRIDEARPSGGRSSSEKCRRNGQRTHSWTKVSDEKRNADECSPTGGKSDRHR